MLSCTAFFVRMDSNANMVLSRLQEGQHKSSTQGRQHRTFTTIFIPKRDSTAHPVPSLSQEATQQVRLRSGSVQSNCEKLRNNYGTIAENWCCNHTSRSLKERHLCTGHTQGTNEHVRGFRQAAVAGTLGQIPKLRKCV